MACLEEAMEHRGRCIRTRDDGYERCDRWEEERTRECTTWEEERTQECDSWGAFSWVCIGWVWIVSTVCAAWTWVVHATCVSWTWVSNVFCIAWSYIVEAACLVWQTIVVFFGSLFGSSERIDVHTHLLTLHAGTVYFVAGIVEALADAAAALAGGRTGRNRDLLVRSEDLGKDMTHFLASLANTLRIFTLNNSTEVYKELRRTYLWKYKVVPVMLDLSHFSKGQISALIRTFDEVSTNLNNAIAQQSDINVLQLQAQLETIVAIVKENSFWGLIDDEGPTYSWDMAGGMKELLEAATRYPRNVFPFLGVDPRRKGIVELVKTNVSLNGPFYGVKLYPPMGFTPTDPVLFGGPGSEDCIFRYCEDNRIPITAHVSPGGFGTLATEFQVNGLIHRGEGVNVSIQGFSGPIDGDRLQHVIGTVRFSTGIPGDIRVGFTERSRVLNHPNIWKKVLEKYPSLYLNLAHFGGQEEATAYALEPRDEEPDDNVPKPWTKIIEGFLDDYDNAYADLAAFANATDLELFKEHVYDNLSPTAKSKILYGSDFDVLMLFELSVADYLADFQRIFGDEDFDAISIENPRRFLFDRP